MKKAKIMLMTIAIVGVVGGALAFKATRFTGRLWVCTTIFSGGPSVCTQPGYTTAIHGFFSTVYTATTALSIDGACYNATGSFYCKTAASTVTMITDSFGE